MTNKLQIKEDIFTHEYLWRSSTYLFECLNEESSYKKYIPTLVTTYMAYEAFVNFLGLSLLPDLWIQEKKTFKGKGIEGKLNEIIRVLPEFSWQKGEREYQLIREVGNFRDLVVHGKVQKNTYSAYGNDTSEHYSFEHQWDFFLEYKKILKVRRNH